jgi:hypothetical protein
VDLTIDLSQNYLFKFSQIQTNNFKNIPIKGLTLYLAWGHKSKHVWWKPKAKNARKCSLKFCGCFWITLFDKCQKVFDWGIEIPTGPNERIKWTTFTPQDALLPSPLLSIFLDMRLYIYIHGIMESCLF